jgi:hypothetical protein
MSTRESLLLRASRLRSSLTQVDDPIGRILLQALIDAMEDSADEKDRGVPEGRAPLRLLRGGRPSP